MDNSRLRPGKLHNRDLVVIVPGIMGSELVDVNQRVLWGLADPRWYVSAWTSGVALEALELTDEERTGVYGRVRPTRLLRFPAFMPFLAGCEPYTGLLKGVRSVACHPDAVKEFPYDWRLPVAYNGRRLARCATRLLEDWRDSPPEVEARQADPAGDQPARLVLVAHSMGGLLARQACADLGFAAQVRAVITLGTPFFGAPKAVLMLASGRAAGLPRSRVRKLVSGLPGLYDLLPSYRCVSDPAEGAAWLTAHDIGSVGGSSELASMSLAWQQEMSGVGLPGHVQVVGLHQPTVQSVTIKDGVVTGHRHTYAPSATGTQMRDEGGDGSVPRVSAALPERPVTPFAQSHGAIASSSDTVLVVQDTLTQRRTGPWQGDSELGLDIPDVIAAGQPWQVGITGAERSTDVRCAVFDVGTGMQVDVPGVGAVGDTDEVFVATAQPLPPGLFRVRLDGGGASPVEQIIMSADIIRPGAESISP